MREFGTDKGREGVQNPGNFADVLYEWSLIANLKEARACACVYTHTQNAAVERIDSANSPSKIALCRSLQKIFSAIH